MSPIDAMGTRTRSPTLIAHHLIPYFYGHWPPNDLRGSGSNDFYDRKFEPLGPIHHGSKPHHLQPSRGELRAFHKQVEPLLNFPVFWIDDAMRQVIAQAFGEVMREQKYTCYACAICSNHMHLLIRRHKHSYEEMWNYLTERVRERLAASHPEIVSPHHPVFAQRPYSVFKNTPEEVVSCVDYVEKNPMKEGLAAQCYDFVVAYDGWPLHHQRAGR